MSLLQYTVLNCSISQCGPLCCILLCCVVSCCFDFCVILCVSNCIVFYCMAYCYGNVFLVGLMFGALYCVLLCYDVKIFEHFCVEYSCMVLCGAMMYTVVLFFASSHFTLNNSSSDVSWCELLLSHLHYTATYHTFSSLLQGVFIFFLILYKFHHTVFHYFVLYFDTCPAFLLCRFF